MPETILCGNSERHEGRPVKAVALLSWPDGRYKPQAACAGCLADCVRDVRDPLFGHPLLVSPVTEPEEARQYRVMNGQRLRERLGYAVHDPGAILAREVIGEDLDWNGTPTYEPLTKWQKRAVLAVLKEEGRD
jgi:hypothetical protein